MGLSPPIPVWNRLKLDSFFSGLIRVRTPWLTSFRVSGLLGITKISISTEVSVPGFTLGGGATDSSLSYGVGMDYLATGNWLLGIEIMKYYDADGVTLGGTTATLSYEF